MLTVERSALVTHTAAQMFALVNDVERYPEFLPWCTGAAVEEESPLQRLATVKVARGVLQTEFTTRNTLIPDARIELQLVHGPFRNLTGVWRFEAIGRARLSRAISGRFRIQEPAHRRRLQRGVRIVVRDHGRGVRESCTQGLCLMRVAVVCALPERVCTTTVELPAGATIEDALTAAAQLPDFTGLDLSATAVGVFGLAAPRGQLLCEGDRVEIYRPLRADAKAERRARVVAARKRARL